MSFYTDTFPNSLQLSPEYLGLLQQYTNQQQAYQQQNQPPQPPPPAAPARRPLSPFARQQQNLQAAYQRSRVPAIAPPRPRLTLHPQALAQAEAQAEYQAQLDARNRQEANLRLKASPSDAPAYQVAAYPDQKLGTFEQELLQLVSANQAQELKLNSLQPKRLLKPEYYQPQYQSEYAKPVAEPQGQQHQGLPEQYHIETSAPTRYQHQAQPAPQQAAYHQAQEPALQYQAIQHQYQPRKPAYRPALQYQEIDEATHYKQLQLAQVQAEAENQAQAHAEAQALAFQKISQASHHKHQTDALEQIRLVAERHREQTALEERQREQSALEQIREGSQVSEAGRVHQVEQSQPQDPEAAYQQRLKQAAADEIAEARRAKEAAEYKAHSDAILKLQATQQAHLKAQEDAHNYALNFEKNQLRAQAHAQAIAQAQAEALYKTHQAQRLKANNEVLAISKAQSDARKADPDHAPVIQYLLPNSNPTPQPSQNSYYSADHSQKYQPSGSSYVARSVPKTTPATTSAEEQVYAIPITQPKQPHKLKVPPSSQSSPIYVAPSGLLKKPVKSLTIEEIIEQDQITRPQVARLPSSKSQQLLTREDLIALINAGYSVTPVPEAAAKPTQPSYRPESSSAGYYLKKQRVPVAAPRPEYVYEQVLARPQQRPVARKHRPILKQEQIAVSPADKVTFLVPLDPAEYGTRQPQTRRNDEVEE